jgi:hypothetical protein
MVRNRILRLTAAPGQSPTAGVLAALAFFLIFVASLFLYEYTQRLLYVQRSYAAYWPVKFLFVALVASTGIIISSVLEEGVIGRMSSKSGHDLSFYTSVIRANYVTLGAILLVGAIMTLPERIRSPGFLVGWLDQIWICIRSA